jgi:N-acetylmuramoyl-L-alanine amidase
MRKISRVIIHCSATKPSMFEVDVDWIRHIHVAENGWSDIGYHYVITRDGRVQKGRPLEVSGAHCKGYNSNSIGICLVGGMAEDNSSEFNFNAKQMQELNGLLMNLEFQKEFEFTVHGHNEFSGKSCPNFNVKEWVKYG